MPISISRSLTSFRRGARRSKPSRCGLAASLASTNSCARTWRSVTKPTSSRRRSTKEKGRSQASSLRPSGSRARSFRICGSGCCTAAFPRARRRRSWAVSCAAISTCSSRRPSSKSAWTCRTQRRWSSSTPSVTVSRSSISCGAGSGAARESRIACSSIPTMRAIASASKFSRNLPTDSKSPTKICACGAPASLPVRCSRGVTDLRLGDVIRDFDVYRAAKEAAEKIVEHDPNLARARTRRVARGVGGPAQHPRAAAFVVRVMRGRRE